MVPTRLPQKARIAIAEGVRQTLLTLLAVALLSPLLACQHLGAKDPGAGASRELSVPETGTPEFLYLLARELEASGRYEEALLAYEKAAAADPGDAFLLRRAAELAGRARRQHEHGEETGRCRREPEQACAEPGADR